MVPLEFHQVATGAWIESGYLTRTYHNLHFLESNYPELFISIIHEVKCPTGAPFLMWKDAHSSFYLREIEVLNISHELHEPVRHIFASYFPHYLQSHLEATEEPDRSIETTDSS